MANYAIVVGISEYDNAPSLSTPLDDALRMAAWLLDPSRGGVPEANLLLLLNPISPPSGTIPGGVDLSRLAAMGNLLPATHNKLLEVFPEFERRLPESEAGVPGGGERLYFYYAGHGMQSRVTFSNEDAIVPSDYLKDVRKAISVSSILRFFQAAKFPEQFFFFDCCRDLPMDEADLDRAPPRRPDLTRLAGDQYVFQATAPGFKALDGRGMLTDLLLDGLTGAGKAKLWSAPDGHYVVRVHRLFQYVKERFDSRPAPAVVGHAGGTTQIQKPSLSGEHREDPAIAVLPEEAVDPVAIDIDLQPSCVLPVAQIRVQSDGASPLGVSLITQTPVRFDLKPRIYAISVDAPSHLWSFDKSFLIRELYDPEILSVTATPFDPSLSLGTRGMVRPEPDVEITPAFASPQSAPPSGEEAPSAGRLTVRTDDPLALLELVDASGAAVSDAQGNPLVGAGALECTSLPPGAYRARLIAPDGEPHDRLVMVGAGQDSEVALAAPPPTLGLMQDLIQQTGFRIREDKAVEMSERAPAVAAPAISTVLALASSATNHDWHGNGERLRKIGLPSWRSQGLSEEATSSGLEALFALEAPPAQNADAYLDGIEIRFWPFDQPSADARQPALSLARGVASFFAPAAPGAHWLEVRATTGLGATFAAHLFADRIAQWVFHQDLDGRIHVHQFAPAVRDDAAAAPDRLRRVDLAQRFLSAGEVREGLSLLGPLLDGDEVEPIAACLGGHALARLRHWDRLGALSERMTARFPTLPDAHVLAALAEAAEGRHDNAAVHFRAAVDCGIPLLAPLLTHLAEAETDLQTEARRARGRMVEAIGDRLVPGLLWTAWTPSEAGWQSRPDDAQHAAPRKESARRGAAPRRHPLEFPVSRRNSPRGEFLSFSDRGDHEMSDPTLLEEPVAAPEDELLVPGLCMNQPNGGPLSPEDPAGEAVATRAMADVSKLWPNGSALNVVFLNGADAWGQAIRQAVQTIGAIWSDYANITFRYGQATASITVNLVPSARAPYGTYSCYLGTDCARVIPQNIPSMNLVFHPSLQTDPTFMQQEFSRVILHEFGHALGMIHEHMRPDRKLVWNFPALRQRFGRPPNGWTDQQIRQQIVNFYQGGSLKGGSFDITSIMMYQFPPGLATYDDGTPFQTPSNAVLSPGDKVVASMLYPKTGVTNPSEAPLLIGDAATQGAIQTAGQVARYRFQPQAAGPYLIKTHGSTPLLVALLAKRGDPAGRMLAAEGANVSLGFVPRNLNQDHFIEVRHAKPTRGTGSFSISVEKYEP